MKSGLESRTSQSGSPLSLLHVRVQVDADPAARVGLSREG